MFLVRNNVVVEDNDYDGTFLSLHICCVTFRVNTLWRLTSHYPRVVIAIKLPHKSHITPGVVCQMRKHIVNLYARTQHICSTYDGAVT
jgi:hypothetical protein